MKKIERNNSNGHTFNKVNLTTKVSKGKFYDEYVCENCGIKGKSFDLNTIVFNNNVDINKIYACPNPKPFKIPKVIKIKYCRAVGSQFENLTPDSIHSVVTPPEGYTNDNKGVWVMGVGEKVKVLRDEYNIIE